MNRLCKKVLFIRILIGLAVLISPSYGQAVGEYAGTYFGTFNGSASGQFTALVRADNTAVISFYDQADEEGAIIATLPVNPDGSFSFAQESDTTSGTFTATGISGTSTGPGTSVVFNGTRSPSTGPLEYAGGYFSGTKQQGTVSCGGEPLGTDVSGTIELIVAEDGMSYMFGITNLDGDFLGMEGGFFSVSDSGVISGTLLDNTQISGSVSLGVPEANGQLYFNDGDCIAELIWYTPRVEGLPRPPSSPSGNRSMPWLPILLE
jgi:hypothetical protein